MGTCINVAPEPRTLIELTYSEALDGFINKFQRTFEVSEMRVQMHIGVKEVGPGTDSARVEEGGRI